MLIRIEPHTLQRALERGATREEITETILTGEAIPAKANRLGKSKAFSFGKEWNKKSYADKKFEVYYLIENEIIITVTVYVFFGNFEMPLKDINLTDLIA